MIKQFFTLAIRNLLKDKIFSFINVTNLVVGFTTFILLALFIFGQLNWDKHNLKYDRIYRLQMFMDQEGNAQKHTWSVTAALARNVLPTLPEIEKVVLMHDVGDNNKNGVFLSKDKKNQVLTRWGYFADQSVFEVFTFNFLEGNMKSALVQPFSIVLSKSVADKLFPNGKAIGNRVYGENKVVFTVTGVYTDFPFQSDWRPSYLLPMNTFGPITKWTDYEQDYTSYSFMTCVLLKENANPATVNTKIHDALKNYRKEHHPYLKPMSLWHVDPWGEGALYIVLGLFSFTAILILVLVSINYINLQTANASTRMREIGIKKAVGFSKNNLLAQFILESVLMTMIAGICSILIAQLFVPVFNNIVGNPAINDVLNNWKIIGLVLFVSFLTGLFAGLYPAFVISAYNPIKSLKQRYIQNDATGISLKNILVTAQFSISLFLLIVSFIIYRQTNFMLNSDPGFNSTNLAYANITTNRKGSFDLIRQKLLSHPEIADACFSDYIPFIIPGGDDLNWNDSRPTEKIFVRFYKVSHDFFATYGIGLKEGRTFSGKFSGDNNKCLVNETLVHLFRWNKPIGKHVRLYQKDFEVIGVVKDYIIQSFFNPPEPNFYRLIKDTAGLSGIYTVRYFQGKEKKAMQIIKSEFEQSFPDDAFEFQDFRNLMVHENAFQYFKIFRNISVFFAVLSIIISSIGLFGLVMFFTKWKMKEIGLRKVFGFSFQSLYYTMSKGFIQMFLISVIVAWPAAYCVYLKMPGAHHYRLGLSEFLLATLIILAIALITISYQIIRAAQTKPVEILKEE
ncbi:MAG: ABC transporter permease [Bacteroidota bacterium]|nr:ABC transporter permease [Bacteroidota bacterium]